MQNRLTIKDIARLSGVGKSTVSRVLNNESGVSERTRERVEAVMQQHGFSPSRSARAMRGQSDKVVAIIVTRLDSLSENLAVQTMLPAFYEQGYDPIMMESQFSPALVEEHLGMLARRNIDGVVLFGFTGIDEAMLAPWRDTLVLMARDAPGFASVCYDDEGAITLLMQRLYDRGHRHISFLGVPHSDVTTGERRHLAYLAFCKKHRLTPTAALPGLGMKQGYDTVASVLTAETSAPGLRDGYPRPRRQQVPPAAGSRCAAARQRRQHAADEVSPPGNLDRRSGLCRVRTPGRPAVDRADRRQRRSPPDRDSRRPQLISLGRFM